MSRFDFKDERIVDIFGNPGCGQFGANKSQRPQAAATNQSNKNYYKHLKLAQQQQKMGVDDLVDDDHRCLRTEFPPLEMDRCVVVTDRNVYMIELR